MCGPKIKRKKGKKERREGGREGKRKGRRDVGEKRKGRREDGRKEKKRWRIEEKRREEGEMVSIQKVILCLFWHSFPLPLSYFRPTRIWNGKWSDRWLCKSSSSGAGYSQTNPTGPGLRLRPVWLFDVPDMQAECPHRPPPLCVHRSCFSWAKGLRNFPAHLRQAKKKGTTKTMHWPSETMHEAMIWLSSRGQGWLLLRAFK